MKRVLSTALIAGVLVATGGSAAMATTYPAPVPSAFVSDGTVAPGEALTFTGNGFTPGETVNITATNENAGAGAGNGGGAGGGAAGTAVATIIAPLETQTLSAVADPTGKFSIELQLSETGTYALTAVGAESGKTVSSMVTVLGAEAAPAAAPVNGTNGDGLADTGVSPSLIAWGAAGLAGLGLGTASLIAVKRKSATDAA